jgi:hypothetical protein
MPIANCELLIFKDRLYFTPWGAARVYVFITPKSIAKKDMSSTNACAKHDILTDALGQSRDRFPPKCTHRRLPGKGICICPLSGAPQDPVASLLLTAAESKIPTSHFLTCCNREFLSVFCYECLALGHETVALNVIKPNA